MNPKAYPFIVFVLLTIACGYYTIHNIINGFNESQVAHNQVEQNNIGTPTSSGGGFFRRLFGKNAHPQTLPDIIKSAEAGNADAQLLLGRLYYKGQGVLKNDLESFKWLLKSAEQGNANAQNKVGFMYDEGAGIAKNASAAFAWYQKSAAQGNADGEYNLGICYFDRMRAVQNYVTGLQWLEKAAAQNHAPAIQRLRLFETAMDPESILIQAVIGSDYELGMHTTSNNQEALKWYRLAITHAQVAGTPNATTIAETAQYGIARMYLSNKGATQQDWDSLPLFIKDKAKSPQTSRQL